MSTPERGRPGSWEYLLHWDGGYPHPAASLDGVPVSDYQAAWLIKHEYGDGWLRRGAVTGTWHVWTGKASVPDISGWAEKIVTGFGARMRQAVDEVRGRVMFELDQQIRLSGQEMTEPATRRLREQAWEPWKAAEKYAHKLATAAGKAALVSYLATECTVGDDELAERQPGLLNLDNGTLNLATLAVQPHNRADGMTHVLPVNWNANEQCPKFLNLVYQVCGWDASVAEYLLKCLGYSLLGDNREQKVFFINGPSGSGKSVLLHVVSELLGQLAHRSGADLICVVRHGRNARTENSIRGKRLITITETSKYMTIDEGQLKRITGEPVISVDQHYSKVELKTNVTWCIWVATNEMPNLVNFDTAMKRRLIVIPGGPGLPEDAMNPHLGAAILSSERAGVLALLAKGCREYNRTGHLLMPLAVQMSTDRYAAEQDTVAAFVADTMVLGGWGEGIIQHQAWDTYVQWSHGGPRLPKTEFYARMREQPGVTYNGASRRFDGVAWNVDWAARVR